MSPSHPTVVPTLRYTDARKAIDWLCEVFGFEPHLVVPDEADGVAHAQLVLGNGMVMLGSARDDEWGQFVKPANALGGNSQSAYVVVPDCEAHYQRAKERGARIAMGLETKPYGGSGYGAWDLEGNVWSFGSYDPFAESDGGA
ncbi:MAG: VOC family protein [Myxococcota bacterium]